MSSSGAGGPRDGRRAVALLLLPNAARASGGASRCRGGLSSSPPERAEGLGSAEGVVVGAGGQEDARAVALLLHPHLAGGGVAAADAEQRRVVAVGREGVGRRLASLETVPDLIQRRLEAPDPPGRVGAGAAAAAQGQGVCVALRAVGAGKARGAAAWNLAGDDTYRPCTQTLHGDTQVT